MARKVSDGRSIQTSSCIDVDSVDDLVGALAAIRSWMRRLVLSSWREQQTSVWGEG